MVGPINSMLDTVPFSMHCYSLDWHPSDHVSFTDNAHLRKIAPDSKVTVRLGEKRGEGSSLVYRRAEGSNLVYTSRSTV